MANKVKIALVAIANKAEMGGERTDMFVESAFKMLTDEGMSVHVCKSVWNAKEALEAIDNIQQSEVDVVMLIHVNWIQDSIQYIFANKLNMPFILFAVPNIETFSLASTQHFSSVLKKRGIAHKCIYGNTDEKNVAREIKSYSVAVLTAKKVKKAVIGLIGPRQTCRVAGAQDMAEEEWDFSQRFGTTIVHIEMTELIEKAKKVSDVEASKIAIKLGFLEEDTRIKVNFTLFLKSIKIYIAIKKIYEKYKIDAIAAECYPEFGGICNLAASLLADEGLILDTEGDISHTMLMYALAEISEKPPATIMEIVGMGNDTLYYAHEGSTAMSLADKQSEIAVNECGDGLMVGFPLKQLPIVTLCDISGVKGNYIVMTSTGETIKPKEKLWKENLMRMLSEVKPVCGSKLFINNALKKGMDHHCIIKPGNVTSELIDFCEIIGIEYLEIQ